MAKCGNVVVSNVSECAVEVRVEMTSCGKSAQLQLKKAGSVADVTRTADDEQGTVGPSPGPGYYRFR